MPDPYCQSISALWNLANVNLRIDMPQTTHIKLPINGSSANYNMIKLMGVRSMSAPAFEGRDENQDAVEGRGDHNIPKTAHRMFSVDAQIPALCPVTQQRERTASIASHESSRDSSVCNTDREEILTDDSVFQSGVKDSGVFGDFASVNSELSDIEVCIQQVEDSRTSSLSYTSDYIDEVLQSDEACACNVGGNSVVTNLEFVAVEGTATLPKVEVKLATPLEEHKTLEDGEAFEEVGLRPGQNKLELMNESEKGNNGSSLSNTMEEQQRVPKGILKVPLDIRKNYGPLYDSHVLLVDEVSFQTEMARTERSGLMKSEKKAFKKLKKIDCMSRGGSSELDSEDTFILDMIPTAPTPVSPAGDIAGESGVGGEARHFIFPPEVGTIKSEPVRNKEFFGLPKYNGNTLGTPDPPRPKDHMLFTLLVSLCCNPFLGLIAFGFSVATNIYYDKGEVSRSKYYSWWAKALAIMGIIVSVLLCITLLIVFWPTRPDSGEET